MPNPFKELLIWALLLNRKDMAMLFWRSGKDHIGGALIASAICKSLSMKADGEEQIDLSSELRDHSQSVLHCISQSVKVDFLPAPVNEELKSQEPNEKNIKIGQTMYHFCKPMNNRAGVSRGLDIDM